MRLASALLALAITPALLAQPQAGEAKLPPSTVPNTGIRVPNNLPTPANPALPTLWLIGDSTVRNGRADGSNGQWGWGEPLMAFFDAAKINVVNRAIGGLSSRTYLTQGHWDRVLAMAKKGDYLLMQFGHNDGGAVNDNSRARGSLAGVGDNTQEIDNMLTGKHEVVQSYGWYLRRFVTDAKAKGLNVMVCSMVPRKVWKDGKIERNQSSYAGWAAAVAKSEGVPFLDLNELIARRYEELGRDKVEPLFADEHTHTSRSGAELNAEVVVLALQEVQSQPLGQYLSEKGKQMVAAGKVPGDR